MEFEVLVLVRSQITLDVERLVKRGDRLYTITVRVGVYELRARAEGKEAKLPRDQASLFEQLALRRLFQGLAEFLSRRADPNLGCRAASPVAPLPLATRPR